MSDQTTELVARLRERLVGHGATDSVLIKVRDLSTLLAALDQQSADAELATRLRQERDHYREQYLNLQADAELGRLLREAEERWPPKHGYEVSWLWSRGAYHAEIGRGDVQYTFGAGETLVAALRELMGDNEWQPPPLKPTNTVRATVTKGTLPEPEWEDDNAD